MGQVLQDLEHHLRATKGNLTIEEANVLMQSKANALRAFTLGLGGGCTLTWLAFNKLPNLLRLGLTAGNGFFVGLRSFSWSMQSSLDYMLSLDGTQLQKECGILLLKNYQDHRAMQRVTRLFYAEEVYDDLSDQPIFRWRFRNFFAENAAASEDTEYHASSGEKPDQQKTGPKRKINLETKQHQMNAAIDTVENPFDCIFGLPASAEEIHHSDISSASPRRPIRGNKRTHRRHRKRHQEASNA